MADVAQPGGAEERIAQGMDEHVAVGMGREAVAVGDLHAAQDQPAAGGEGVDVETVADAHQGCSWRRR